MSPFSYRLLADLILIAHFGIVLFIVAGLVLPIIGVWCRWEWVHTAWIRVTHLAVLGIIVVQSWLSIDCPLTMWEHRLRNAADEDAPTYTTTFVQYWVSKVLFFDIPLWVFAIIYSVMGLLCIASLLYCPIRWRRLRPPSSSYVPASIE